MGKKEFSNYLQTRIGNSRNAKTNLANELGVHGSNITKYLKGVNLPTMDKAIRIAQILGDDPQLVLQLAGHEVPEGMHDIEYAVHKLPLAGLVKEGKIQFHSSYQHNIFSRDIASEYIELSAMEAGHNDYCLKLEGDSLFPAFPSGSIALVSPAKPFSPNMLCAVRSTDGPAWLRFVTMYNTVYTLASINPGFAPFSIDKSEVAFIHPVRWVIFP